MSFNNNDFGYSTPENSGSDFNAYPFGVACGETSTGIAQTSGFHLNTTVADLNTAKIEDRWSEPKSDGDVGQYTGSALLNSCKGFAGPYDSQTWNISGTNGLDTSECYPGLSLVINRAFSVNNGPRSLSRFRRTRATQPKHTRARWIFLGRSLYNHTPPFTLPSSGPIYRPHNHSLSSPGGILGS